MLLIHLLLYPAVNYKCLNNFHGIFLIILNLIQTNSKMILRLIMIAKSLFPLLMTNKMTLSGKTVKRYRRKFINHVYLKEVDLHYSDKLSLLIYIHFSYIFLYFYFFIIIFINSFIFKHLIQSKILIFIEKNVLETLIIIFLSEYREIHINLISESIYFLN